jgi:hypothetical protein
VREKDISVFLHNDLSKDLLLLPLKDLYAVISLNWRFDPLRSGIPPELVEKMYDDYQGLTVEKAAVSETAVLQILYISAGSGEEGIQLLQVISLMNLIPGVVFTVCCQDAAIGQLRTYANEHIQFIRMPRAGVKDKMLSGAYHLVMTFGPGALHFLRQGMPVLVAGPRGFGGLVLKENFPGLLFDSFMGRPGGNLQEPLPPLIVQEELQYWQQEIGSLQDEVIIEAKKVYHRPISAADEVRGKAISLFRTLQHREDRRGLKPRLASNIEFVRKAPAVYLRRKGVGDTIAVIDETKSGFMEKLTGTKDCSELQSLSGLKEKQFWEYMYQLWDQKIIVF